MIRTVSHTFRPGETVEAILKKINRHDVTESELRKLLIDYHTLNGSEVPRAGTQVKIPMLTRHTGLERLRKFSSQA